ncbi:hypothetical protein QOZ80_2BG0155160 [Eleusine coracana subsp. coracana]|nr:hypothetical protein QOZ80_2BG0155160 [Eleusine coracana subsp. coracana]
MRRTDRRAQQVPPPNSRRPPFFAPSLSYPTTTTACAIDGGHAHALVLLLSRRRRRRRCFLEMSSSFPFPTQPLVSPARKKDDRKDAAVMLAAPMQSGERGEGKAAVAVDGDRGSQYALKWAADHILSRTRSFFLLHVRRKHTSLHGHGGKQFAISHVQDDVAATFHAQLQCRETILDGADVSKAIVDFVASNNIDKLVLGASSRNAFTRLMPVHGAVSVDGSFDESTDDGSLTSASSYLKTGSSWPSEFSETDQHSSYFSPEYLEYNRDRLLLPNKGNDQALIAPNGKYLGFDESSFNDSALSPGYNISDQELKIGEGGYGPVYKATLDNTTVAIKILHSNITQGLKQFRQEVDLLNNIRHPNMVHLVGACPEYGCLVYEYMPNGSLEDRLFCRSGTPPLPWRLRFKMAMEIANGLLYLHKLKPEAFVHRDLKPGNILIDADFVSKIGDVGLARIIPLSIDDAAVTQYRETAAAGTFCYIDPEYQKTGLVCTKSDVYALGVIYLQMITGKDAMGLAYTVSDALEEGTFAELLDGNVTGWPEQEARELAELALKCCEMRRKDRPDLESVVLPELIRLYKVVTSSSGDSSPPSMDHHQRSASEKDLPLDDHLVDILNDKIAKGASFAV